MARRALAGAQDRADQDERTIVWVDGSGLYLLPGTVRTYAPRGQTSTLRLPLSRDHPSVISDITPAGRLLILVQERAYKSPDVVRFLKHLPRHIPGKLLVSWDGSPLHRGQPVKDILVQGGAGWTVGQRAVTPGAQPASTFTCRAGHRPFTGEQLPMSGGTM